jgi:hypothetical protein
MKCPEEEEELKRRENFNKKSVSMDPYTKSLSEDEEK